MGDAPDEGRDPSAPPPERDADAPLDFDPYRFGRPDHPIAPEYAPPGYVPPPDPHPQPPATAWPPTEGGPPPNGPYGTPPGQYGPPPNGPYGTPPGQYGPPPYGQYGAPPSYQPPPYGAPRTGNTKAVISLVLGILAIVLSWASVYDLLLIVPAIVLGAIARHDATHQPQRGGKGMATGGLVCGIVALVLAVVSTIYFYNRLKPCLDQYSPTSKAFQTCATDRIVGHD